MLSKAGSEFKYRSTNWDNPRRYKFNRNKKSSWAKNDEEMQRYLFHHDPLTLANFIDDPNFSGISTENTNSPESLRSLQSQQNAAESPTTMSKDIDCPQLYSNKNNINNTMLFTPSQFDLARNISTLSNIPCRPQIYSFLQNSEALGKYQQESVKNRTFTESPLRPQSPTNAQEEPQGQEEEEVAFDLSYIDFTTPIEETLKPLTYTERLNATNNRNIDQQSHRGIFGTVFVNELTNEAFPTPEWLAYDKLITKQNNIVRGIGCFLNRLSSAQAKETTNEVAQMMPHDDDDDDDDDDEQSNQLTQMQPTTHFQLQQPLQLQPKSSSSSSHLQLEQTEKQLHRAPPQFQAPPPPATRPPPLVAAVPPPRPLLATTTPVQAQVQSSSEETLSQLQFAVPSPPQPPLFPAPVASKPPIASQSRQFASHLPVGDTFENTTPTPSGSIRNPMCSSIRGPLLGSLCYPMRGPMNMSHMKNIKTNFQPQFNIPNGHPGPHMLWPMRAPQMRYPPPPPPPAATQQPNVWLSPDNHHHHHHQYHHHHHVHMINPIGYDKYTMLNHRNSNTTTTTTTDYDNDNDSDTNNDNLYRNDGQIGYKLSNIHGNGNGNSNSTSTSVTDADSILTSTAAPTAVVIGCNPNSISSQNDINQLQQLQLQQHHQSSQQLNQINNSIPIQSQFNQINANNANEKLTLSEITENPNWLEHLLNKMIETVPINVSASELREAILCDALNKYLSAANQPDLTLTIDSQSHQNKQLGGGAPSTSATGEGLTQMPMQKIYDSNNKPKCYDKANQCNLFTEYEKAKHHQQHQHHHHHHHSLMMRGPRSKPDNFNINKTNFPPLPGNTQQQKQTQNYE